jgi:hypothetical protein
MASCGTLGQQMIVRGDTCRAVCANGNNRTAGLAPCVSNHGSDIFMPALIYRGYDTQITPSIKPRFKSKSGLPRFFEDGQKARNLASPIAVRF